MQLLRGSDWERDQRMVVMEKVETELNSLISEYLTWRGYLQSHAMFQTECHHRTQEAAPTKTSGGGGAHSDFLVAFECGERSAFFQFWDEHIPLQLRDSDPTCQNLEFSISVYFAVYPLRTGSGSAAQSMQEFKAYLESRGAVLAQSHEFATYCALPYVPDPTKHPSFKSLFSDSWLAELKARLEQFVKLTLPDTNSPQLLSIYLNSKHSSLDSRAMVQSLQVQLANCERRYMRKLTEVQSSYHTLVGIAMELVEALESAVAGRMITPEYIHGMCSRLFGSAVQQPMDIQRPSTGTSLLRESVMTLRDSVQPPTTTDALQAFPPLDYERIKTDLSTASGQKRALIVQALRWRLTRSLPGEQRNSILTSFIENDIIGCTSSSSHQAIVVQLLTSGSSLIKEHLCRLFNTLSSLASGRGYLSQSPVTLRALCGVMVREGGDTHIRRNALGAIQKLSLKRSLQMVMVECGLVRWLFELLRDHDTLSEYTVRYSLALLMNLSLRSAGKKSCVPFGATALKVLSELLEHDDQEICSYVNGILYSLLSLPEMREEAKAMGMNDMLTSALQASPSELKGQLKYIITQLNSDATAPSGESGDETDEDEEEDPEIIEGEEGETTIDSNGLSGEALLIKEYLAAAEPVGVSALPPQAKKVLEAPYVRPVTPQMFGNRPQTSHLPSLSETRSQVKSEFVTRSVSSAT